MDSTHSSRRSPRLGADFLIVSVLAIVVACLVLLNHGRNLVLSAVRAYVGGEGLYAKGQKDAVFFLIKYAQSHDGRDYDRYLAALRLPLGDSQARLELEKSDPDLAVAYQGFITGGNHPDDVANLAWLFRHFHHVSYIAKAIDYWTEADGCIARLRELGSTLHDAVDAQRADARTLAPLVAEIDRLNERLTQLEDGFSLTLGEGNRWLTMVLTRITYGASAVLVGLGGVLSWTILRRARASADALRDSEARARAILDTTVDGIITIDEHGTIESFNPSAVRIFGWTPDEVRGQNVRVLMPAPYRSEHDDYLRNYRRTGEKKIIGIGREVLGQRKDGSRFAMDLAVSEVHLGARRIFTGIVRDVSDRTRADAERERLLALAEQARANAEAASYAKDQFLATVSHELRTPLSPILTWAHMLQMGTLDAAKSRHAVEAIVRNVHTQARLVDDLLDVSRIVSGKLRVDVQPVEPVPVVEAAVESLRPAADAKQVHLHLRLDPRVGRVSGDPQRLQQIVWNLVSNAVKFTPRGGHVTVGLERVDEHVELAVSDTGQGIEPRLLPHLFERFWQAESGTTRHRGGLGLGLAIVRHLTELHGGTVSAYSAGIGHGAVFRVVLPLKRMTDDTPAPEGTPPGGNGAGRRPARLTGIRVLIVDNEQDSNEALQLLLASYGAEVRGAVSAAQALETLDAWRPDVLVSDIGMPVEDGYALIRRLRARVPERGGELPAVALTGYGSVEDRVRVLTAGFQMHVVKPVDPTELAAVVAMLAGRGGPA